MKVTFGLLLSVLRIAINFSSYLSIVKFKGILISLIYFERRNTSRHSLVNSSAGYVCTTFESFPLKIKKNLLFVPLGFRLVYTNDVQVNLSLII